MEPADKHQEEEIVPKGGEPHLVLLLFAPFGDDWSESQLSAGFIPFGHSTSGYSHSPPLRGRQDATYETSVYNNWFLFAKKIPKPHKQLIINGFLFAKKIPCNKLLVTLFCFFFFRFHPARFYFSFSTSHYIKLL